MNWKEIREKYQKEVPSWRFDFPQIDFESWLEMNYNPPIEKGKEVNAYKLLHKPTGLYYKPVTRFDSNLGIKGKLYSRKPSIPNYLSIYLRHTLTDKSVVSNKIRAHFKLAEKGYVNINVKTKTEDWEIVKIN